jgi:hypothetical protein
MEANKILRALELRRGAVLASPYNLRIGRHLTLDTRVGFDSIEVSIRAYVCLHNERPFLMQGLRFLVLPCECD